MNKDFPEITKVLKIVETALNDNDGVWPEDSWTSIKGEGGQEWDINIWDQCDDCFFSDHGTIPMLTIYPVNEGKIDTSIFYNLTFTKGE